MGPLQADKLQEAGFVEVLTSNMTGDVIGYRLKGAVAGPQLVVAASCAGSEEVFTRLMRIPTLPWMRGQLLFLRFDAPHTASDRLTELEPVGVIDHTIILPWIFDDADKLRSIRQIYVMVLQACTRMGMISGRGVPPQAVSLSSS